MNTAYINGRFIPKDEVKISPDDRGFLFADGIYEVMRWYKGFFYDMENHMARLTRSLKEVRINWEEASTFPSTALELIERNGLHDDPALIYLQVTRGEAKRAHAFPSPAVPPTVYASATAIRPDNEITAGGINIILHEDIRWKRCDIKSVALLPNILCFQEATESGNYECVFSRNGIITEGTHSNVFFVIDGTLYTHPESENILSGITRKNVLRIARQAGIPVNETAVTEEKLSEISEAFITNTSSEIAPVVSIGGRKTGTGLPGPVTKLLRERFTSEVNSNVFTPPAC